MHGCQGDCAALDAKYPSETGSTDLLDSSIHHDQPGGKPLSILQSPSGGPWNNELITIGLDFSADNPNDDIPDPPGTSIADVIGIVNYGVGGARHTVEVDWRAGTQLTVPASHIDVSAFFQIDTDPEPVPTWRRARLKVSLVYESRSSKHEVTRTTRPAALAAAGSVVFPVPRMAYAVSIASSVIAFYADAASRFRALGGLVAGSPILLELGATAMLASFTNPGGILLPGGTRSIEIVNGAAPTVVRAIWSLAV